MTFTVTPAAQRPARMDGHCFYCRQEIGAEHNPDCVLIKRKVVLRLTVEYETEMPADCDAATIERMRNHGSCCANNVIADLQRQFEHGERCMCGIANFKFVRDASEPYLEET
ncbi:hypothetical protein [Paraburkholderia phenoliruptrix]|uniref:hypothetical protein n=1 Tax=Paraburkholderia phenoliruptrix TaxID=252970 RepID=UPI0034CE78A8